MLRVISWQIAACLLFNSVKTQYQVPNSIAYMIEIKNVAVQFHASGCYIRYVQMSVLWKATLNLHPCNGFLFSSYTVPSMTE